MILSLILFGLVWQRAKSKKVIPLYFCLTGLIYIFEFMILVLYRSYEYGLDVLQDKYFDNILGANISDGFIVPAMTVLYAVFELHFLWAGVIALAFMGTEEWFIRLGVYHHHWWQTIYTGLLIPVHLAIGRWLWREIRQRAGSKLLQGFVLYFSNLAVQASIMFYAALFGIMFYSVDWFPTDASRGHIAFATVYVLVDSIFFTLVVVLRASWHWYTLLIGGLWIVNHIQMETGSLIVQGYWAILVYTALQACMLLLLVRIRIWMTPHTDSKFLP